MKNVIYVIAVTLWLALVTLVVILADTMVDQTARGDSLVIGAVTMFITVFGATLWAVVTKLIQRV